MHASLNNRHLPQGTTWQYDADGRLLTAPNAYKTYDAAGGNTYLDTYGYGTATLGMDGDGRQIKTEETTWDEDWQTYVTETKYYLRSSVLGGRVLSEISGTPYRTFVYAGSTIIASQWGSSGYESVGWEHKDPSGASVRYWENYGQELDPLGGDAGTYAQTETPDEGALLPYGSSYSPANPNIAYSIDGIRVLPDDFMAFAGFDLQDNLRLLEFLAKDSATNGLSPAAFDELRDILGPRLTSGGIPDLTLLLPQNTAKRRLTQDEIDKLRKDLNAMLSKPNCATFINGVLAELNKLPNGVYSTDLMTIFEAIKTQPNGGFFSDPSISLPAVANAFGSFTNGNAQMAFRSLPTAHVAAHETMHVAAKVG